MKFLPHILLLRCLALAVPAMTVTAAPMNPGQTNRSEVRAQFFKLCDMAAAKVANAKSTGPFFVDSYAVRALCVAYDMTGNQNYLDACCSWSERMVTYQEKMAPPGTYYMHYNRKPGETNGDWYVADSSSIGMAVLATSARCRGAKREHFLHSVEKFANLVIKSYVKPNGGVSDGLWHESSDAWWNSSALFGSFLFNLYANTGNELYLKTALGATDWLNHWDLTKPQPFPLSQQGPAMIFYVMENYCAGWPYLAKDEALKQAALGKVNWCLAWIAEQQRKPMADRQWQPTKGWGMKFGGLPFDEYIFSHYQPAGGKLTAAGNAEMQRLASIVFHGKPKFTQLSAFLLISYAERLEPGAIYRAGQ
jgi:hypothetical protein